MTREKLRRYQDILAEIEDLTKTTADTVKASLPDYPYTVHSVKIEAGEDFVRPSTARSDKLAKLRAERREIEQWIEARPNFKTRKIAWLYAQGESWKNIAALANCPSPKAAEMILQRNIEKR